jgi:hypothetical protein
MAFDRHLPAVNWLSSVVAVAGRRRLAFDRRLLPVD